MAQDSGYHTEWTKGTGESQLRRVILVNDSVLAIEAYHGSSQCRRGGSSGHGDVLDYPEQNDYAVYRIGEDGRRIQTKSLEQGGRWETQVSEATVKSKGGVERCEPHMDAVIFEDGSYEGSESWVERLKTRRDGIAVRVAFWSKDLKRTSFDEDSSLDAIEKKAETIVSDDNAKVREYVMRGDDDEALLMHAYWSGRLQVDLNVQMWLTEVAGKATAEAEFRQLAGRVDRWKKKLDEDVASKKLEQIFPASVDRAAVE